MNRSGQIYLRLPPQRPAWTAKAVAVVDARYVPPLVIAPAAAPGFRAYNRGGEYVIVRWEDGLHPTVYSEGLQRCRVSFPLVLILTLVIGHDVKDSRNVIHAMPGKLQGNR